MLSQQQSQQQYVDQQSAALISTLAQQGAAGAGGIRTEQHGNQIVHVRGDSDSDLEALFSVLHNMDTSRGPPSSSYKNRKLPASFFRPPDHHKTSSAGGASHGRSVSSPAQLHHPMPPGAGPPAGSMTSGQSQQQHGFKPAGSSDAGTSSTYGDEFNAAQSMQCRNWDTTSKNCPRYFLKYVI